jgi:hypothetical protein
MHWRQWQNLGPLLFPQLSGHHTIQSWTDRIAVLVDEDAGVVVEAYVAAVRSLLFLSRAYNDGVSDVSSSYFVRDTDAGRIRALAEASLFLHDDYYSVTCMRASAAFGIPTYLRLTDGRGLDLFSHDRNTFDNSCARIVDAIKHRL